VLASAAPLVVAVVLWLITGSPYTLLFAVLGPVTAVASFADSRLGARRSRRREITRFAAEVSAAHDAIDAAHSEERAALTEQAPLARELFARSGADPWRWTCSGPEVAVALGSGSVPSTVRLAGEAADDLAAAAGLLRDAPVVVDAALGIGVCGPEALALAVARALVVQVAWSLSPATQWSAVAEEWGSALPHAGSRRARPGFVAEFGSRDGHSLVAIATASTEADLPAECRIVIALAPEGSSIVQHPDRERRRAVRPGVASREEAARWAAELAQHVPERTALTGAVEFASLPPGAVGVGPEGPVVIDLVEHGPHAVVGGATGSGKSELLVSWVLAMAASRPPDRLAVLLIDFKGGSAFAQLAALPHTVGVVTDLDEQHAARVLASLRAELRYRERTIAEARGRSIDDVEALGRLVIVVDEFAAMLSDHPELHALFTDLAARGRSLGVHLVLCTQRPAGVVRDAVLANADLRISMRVNNRADSAAVVGTDAAASIPSAARGSGILAPPDAEPYAVQFALATGADVERVASRWHGSPPPRRPWCEPLPPVVQAGEAPGGFGLLDLPHEQRRAVATWQSSLDGHVLVLGAARSGTSTALAALAPGARLLPRGVAAAWDALHEIADGTVLAIDDVDSLLARFPADYRATVVETLVALVRDGPARGVHVLLAAKRITADLQSVAALVPERLLLRHASKQEWVLAGGEGTTFTASLPPGGGLWRGDRVQVVLAAPRDDSTAPRIAELEPGHPLAVVTTRPARRGRAALSSATSTSGSRGGEPSPRRPAPPRWCSMAAPLPTCAPSRARASCRRRSPGSRASRGGSSPTVPSSACGSRWGDSGGFRTQKPRPLLIS
jgi:S-DNA-T family DNA segregation ATPase FtsK/SpoIIIE